MSEKIFRSTIEQKEYKDKLVEESIKVYGEAVCYASGLPFKGLIASHIKPYKLCVVEQDEIGKFDINNGLLLSKQLDDYFDKLLISFDENGMILFSEAVPDRIKRAFGNYCLESVIYNSSRKDYMKIHRALFYYKNYYYNVFEASVDLGISNLFCIPDDTFHYIRNKNLFILKEGKKWHSIPENRVKKVLTANKYLLPTYISNEIICNHIKEQEEFCIEYLEDDTGVIHFNNVSLNMIDKKMSERKYLNENYIDLVFKHHYSIPEDFIEYLSKIFEYEEDVYSFLRLLSISISGVLYNKKAAILYGNNKNASIVFKLIEDIFGNYVQIFNNPNMVKGLTNHHLNNSIRIGCFENQKCIKDDLIQKVISTNWIDLQITEDNCDVYISLDNISQLVDKGLYYIFKLNDSSIEVGEYYLSEQKIGEIIAFIVSQFTYQDYEIVISSNETTKNVEFREKILEKWMMERCISSDKGEFASDLYDDYIKYCNESGEYFCAENSTMTWFGRRLGNKYNKLLKDNKRYYVGVSLVRK